jgi:hypothetical protein
VDANITIQIETDDPQTPVYPRITIQQNSVTNVIEINEALDIDKDRWIEGSVFRYTNQYYWVDTEGVKHISGTNDSGFETTSVSITNEYTDDENVTHAFDTVVKNNIKGEIVTIDGANRVILSSRANDRIFGNDFNFVFPKLAPGLNQFGVTGSGTITFEYMYFIKIGNMATEINAVSDPICDSNGNIQIDMLDWSRISNTPNTLEGYGITDAYPTSAVYNKNEINNQIKDITDKVDSTASLISDISSNLENDYYNKTQATPRSGELV